MLQIGVHDDDEVAVRVRDTVDHRARELAAARLAGAPEHVDVEIGMPRGGGFDGIDGLAVQAVVDEDDLIDDAGGGDAAQEFSDVV